MTIYKWLVVIFTIILLSYPVSAVNWQCKNEPQMQLYTSFTYNGYTVRYDEIAESSSYTGYYIDPIYIINPPNSEFKNIYDPNSLTYYPEFQQYTPWIPILQPSFNITTLYIFGDRSTHVYFCVDIDAPFPETPTPTPTYTPTPNPTIIGTVPIPDNNSNEIATKTNEWGNVTSYDSGNGSISDITNRTISNGTGLIQNISGQLKDITSTTNTTSIKNTFGILISAGALDILPDEIWKLLVLTVVLVLTLFIMDR